MGYHFTKLVLSLWIVFKRWQRENIICKEKLKHSMYVHLSVCIFELLVIQAFPFAMNINKEKSHFFFIKSLIAFMSSWQKLSLNQKNHKADQKRIHELITYFYCFPGDLNFIRNKIKVSKYLHDSKYIHDNIGPTIQDNSSETYL